MSLRRSITRLCGVAAIGVAIGETIRVAMESAYGPKAIEEEAGAAAGAVIGAVVGAD